MRRFNRFDCLRLYLGRAGAAIFQLADETETPAMDGPDVFLSVPVVAERLADGFHDGRYRGVRYETAIPDLLDQLVLRNQAVRIFDQVGKHREGAALNGNGFPGAMEFAAVKIQQVSVKHIPQRSSLEKLRFSPRNTHTPLKYATSGSRIPLPSPDQPAEWRKK